MNPQSCPFETNVSHAARTGSWDKLIREHVKVCSHCGEIARITEWMGSVAATSIEKSTLPDVKQIWLNARVLAMQSARKRALRPLVITELVVRIAIALGLAAGIAWLWYVFQSVTASLQPAHLLLSKPLIATATALATCLIAFALTRLVSPALIEE